MSEVKLVATSRTDFGKGAARRTRREGLVPAVLYGHGAEPVHVSLPGHATFLAMKHANVLLTIEIDGKDQLAIAKDIQRDPIKDVIEHIDLLLVQKGEKITVEVQVRIVGESAPGTIHLLETQILTLEAEATNLPETFELSVEGLEAGAQVRAGDLKLPAGATLVNDPEIVVVTVTVPQSSAADEAADKAVADVAAAQSAASALAAEAGA